MSCYITSEPSESPRHGCCAKVVLARDPLRIVAIVVLLVFSNFNFRALAQGQFTFSTKTAGTVDARVTFLDGTPVGAGFFAQMYGGPEGTQLALLKPLFPTTTFRNSGRLAGYVDSVGVTVPGVEGRATLVMRAFNGANWESSNCRGESAPFTITLTSPPFFPADLVGLQPFSVNCIPEPSTLALLLGGAAGFASLAFRRRNVVWRNKQG